MPTLPDIPGFILSEVLGAGASGTVYAAVPDSGPDAGQSMAIKVVSSWPEDPASRGLRALQEARFCFDLDHPHVVRVYDWGQLVDRSTWILMERLRGETLGSGLAEAI